MTTNSNEEAFRPVRWSFYGQIVPGRPAITLQLMPRRWTSMLGFDVELHGHIFQSQVLASVVQLSPVDILTLKNAVLWDIQGSLDLAGAICGAGLDVDIISAQADNGAWQFFDAFIPILEREGEIQIPEALEYAVHTDLALRAALADFREAMRVPIQTGFFCFRSMEALMQSFKKPTAPDGPAWQLLHQNLNTTRAALNRIKIHADWARHGRTGSISDADRATMLVSTKTILTRYMDFILGGRQPLSPVNYPVMM